MIKQLLVLFLLIAFNILLFIFLSSNQKVKKKGKSMTPLDEELKKDNTITFIMFYTNWCKYSKLALPEYIKFKEWVDKDKKNKLDKYKIEALMIDVESDSLNKRHRKILTHAKSMIEGYPTIIIYVGHEKQAYTYTGDRVKKEYISRLESYAD